MFVVPDTYDPMSFQERMTIPLLYKDAWEKQEQEYLDRQDKIDKYSFLDDYDDSSNAKQLYQGYVNEYNKSFDDFQQHGLTQGNKRSWLNVRRKYQKNIGRLDKADTALQEEIKRRQTLDASDPTRIYATDTMNLSIDDFLDNKTPDNYGISGDYLYKKGAEIGASSSSRIYSNPEVKELTDAFVNFTQTQGISQATLDAFRANLASQPAFQKAIMDELKADGATDHLKGVALQRATQSIVNGFVNGAIYKRTDSPQANPDHITAYQQKQIDLANRSYKLELAQNGLREDANGNVVVDNDNPIWAIKSKNGKYSSSGKSSSGSSSSGDDTSSHTPMHGSEYVSRQGRNRTPVQDDTEIHGGKVVIERVNDSSNSGMVTYKLKGEVTGKTYATITKDDKGNYKLNRVDPSRYGDYGDNFRKDFHASYDDEYDAGNIEALGRDVINVLRQEKGDQPYNNYEYTFEPDNLRGGLFRGGNDAGGFYRIKLGNEMGTVANDEDDSGLTPEQLAAIMQGLKVKD